MNQIKVMKIDPSALIPTRAHPSDAGLDLYSLQDSILRPGEGGVVSTGVAVSIPPGNVGLVSDRSSLARMGLKTAGGVIDSGYRGEVRVVLWSFGRFSQTIKRHSRIAQLLILPIHIPGPIEVSYLDDGDRGASGFGSTGI